MIPEQLSIRGLYSYKEKQEIDFSTLISSQLFGIFGAVGSGKSSILEAIMFVLFDQSDRLNKGDNRYYNMLNLQSDDIEVDFTFYAGEKNKNRYRFYFLAQREKKDFEKVKIKDRSFYQWKDNNWTPLGEEENAATILGMNYKNFMQTVIIPQGKFREFVDQKPAVRTQMLKELFQLEKYDLSPKTNILIGRCKSDIDRLEGELQGVGEVSEADIKVLEDEVKEIEEKLDEDVKYMFKLDEGNKALLQLKELFKKLEETQERLQNLQGTKDVFEAREKRLIKYERAFSFFKEKLNQLTETTNNLRQKNDEVKQLRKDTEANKATLTEAQLAQQTARKEFEAKDKIREQCDDLNNLIEIKRISTSIHQLETQVITEQKDTQELKNSGDAQKQKISEIEKKLYKLNDQLASNKALHEIKLWYQRQAEYVQEREKLNQNIRSFQSKKEKISQHQLQLYKQYSYLEKTVGFEDAFTNIDLQREQLGKEESKKLLQLQDLRVKQELTNYTRTLKEGEPCPLCGATHHPELVHSEEDVESKIKIIQQQINEGKENAKSLTDLERQLRMLETEWKSLSKLVENEEIQIQAFSEKLKNHQQEFIWEDYKNKTAEEIQKLLKETDQQQNEAKALRISVENQKLELEQYQKTLEKKQDQLKQKQDKLLVQQTQIASHQKALKHLSFEKFEKYSQQELQQNLDKGNEKLKLIISTFEARNKKYEELKQQYDSAIGRLGTLEELLISLAEKAEALDKELRKLCQEKGFTNIEEIRELLAHRIDIDNERRILDDYKKDLHTAEETFKELFKEADDKQYNETEHVELQDELENVKTRVDLHKKNIALKNRQVEEYKLKLEKRKKLEKQFKVLTHRLENLKVLSSLFRGSGFVEYVSSIYLENLCRAANERFFKLTKNNLSLELNDQNEFVIRDYLNNGKTRLLKTLSGGQTFQAALCLALALAENVKSLNKAEQSFFFLDEGFGALDKEALRIVFNTLKSLQKENRVVGVISHVEELQQEIDVFLKVENDKEKGSIISYSWH